MYLKELWRYPVKSMRGEALEEAEIAPDGVAGDRLLRVEGPRGLITARSRPRLLGLSAALGEDGEARVDGDPWWHPRVEALVREAAGPQAGLVPHAGPGRFDVLPLLVATDGAIAAFGRDGRRLRPNLVIGGVEGLDERGWGGRAMMIGPVVVHLDSLRPRCVMTTFDPGTLEQDAEVLRDIHRRFAGTLALNAAVLTPGRVRVGDTARLLPPH
jgi:uncharacterized protein YcbX